MTDHFFDTIHKTQTLQFEVKFNTIKRKCLSVGCENYLNSTGLSSAYQGRKSRYILTKDLYGVEARVSSQG